jgi:Mycothiol maleylpyruvate isomerase N-terminal domain
MVLAPQPEVAMSAEWNFMDPASRSNLVRTVRAEAASFFELVANTEWEAPTACERWQVRDHVGHMIDVTEGYFVGFDHARAGTDAPGALGLPVMAERLDEHARAFRSLGKEDALKRVHEAYERMLGISEELTDARCRRAATRSSSSSTTPFTVGTSGSARTRQGRSRGTPPTCSCPWRSSCGSRPR